MPEGQNDGTKPVAGLLAVGGLVRDIMALGERLARREREILAPEGLTPAQRDVLVTLKSRGPVTIAGLGRLRGCSRQNARVLVGALVRRGFLQLVPNPAHKRAHLVAITGEGKQVLHRILHREGEVLARMAGSLQGGQTRQAAGALRKISAVLSGGDRPG